MYRINNHTLCWSWLDFRDLCLLFFTFQLLFLPLQNNQNMIVLILSSPPEIAKFYETNRMIGGSCKQARINLSFRRVFASLGWDGLSSCLFCGPYKAAVRSMSDIKAGGTA